MIETHLIENIHIDLQMYQLLFEPCNFWGKNVSGSFYWLVGFFSQYHWSKFHVHKITRLLFSIKLQFNG